MESQPQEVSNSNQVENTVESQNGTVIGDSERLVEGVTYFDMFEGSGIDDVDSYYNNVLFPSVDSSFPRMMRSVGWPGGTGDFTTTVGNTPGGLYAMKIGPGFTSWETTTFLTDAVWRDTVLRALKNGFTATNTRINESNNSISTLKAMDDHLSKRISEVEGYWPILVNHGDWIAGLGTRVDGVQTDLSATNARVLNLERATSSDYSSVLSAMLASLNLIKENTNYLGGIFNAFKVSNDALSAVLSSTNTIKDNVIALLASTNLIKENTNYLGGIFNAFKVSNDNSGALLSSVNNMAIDIKSILTSTNQHKDNTSTNFATLWNYWTSTNTKLDSIVSQNEILDSILTSTNEHKDSTSVNFSTAYNYWKATNEKLDELNEKDFTSLIDLTILVTAINAVGGKVQDLIDVFDVTDPQPNSFAFFFQSLIRSQTLAIVDALAMVDKSLNDNFVNYFSDSKNGQFWTAYKEFSDFQMAVFFGVFFESFQEHWESNWLTVLDVWNTTNSFLATIAGWLDQIQLGIAESKEILSIITNWLKLIYEKPVPSFNVPSFDYVRLENMLKKLEFGEVVNEAGTNIWDFLTSIIDNLGDIITTQLEEFTKVLSEILDFLDGLIDKMIGLIVPKNLDFMRQGFDDVNLKFKAKFGNFLNISASITQMFQPIQKDFINELTFDFMGVPFVPDITILAAFVPKFRNVVALLMWFNVGWWAFRRFTGTGDIVNDN